MNREIVIAVWRSRARLEVVFSRSGADCEFLVVPLPEISSTRFSEAKQLLEAWNALSETDTFDKTTLQKVRFILENTVPIAEELEQLKPINSTLIEKRPPNATAANPRAFKGTKRKLPKPAGLANKLDLRPYLMSPKTTNELIAYAVSQNTGAQNQLSPNQLTPNQLDGVTDLYLAANNADSHNLSIHDLPSKFRQYLLPCLKGAEWGVASRFLKHFWDLDLANDTKLLATTCRYLKLFDCNAALAILAEVSNLPSEFRSPVLKLLTDLKEAGVDVPPLRVGWLENIHMRSLSGHFLKNANFAFRSLSLGLTPEYVGIAIDIHRDFEPMMSPGGGGLWLPTEFTDLKSELKGEEFPVREVYDCLQKQQELPPYSEKFRETPWWGSGIILWRQFAKIPELAQAFRVVPWRTLHPAVAQAYSLLFTSTHKWPSDRDSEIDARVKILLTHHKRITSFLLRTQDQPWHQITFLDDIGRMPDAMSQLQPSIFSKFLDVLERVSVPPFFDDSYLSTLLYALLTSLENHHQDKLITLADIELLRLSRACLRYNETLLISRGLAALSAIAPDLVMSSLVSFHGKLLKVGKLLGAINRKLRAEILAEFDKSAINSLAFPTNNPSESLDCVRTILSSGCAEQLPQKLKRYVRGEIELTDGQVAKSIGVAETKLDLFKLDHLENLCYLRIAPGFDVSRIDGSIQHALQMVQFNTRDTNFRAFKKFLFRYLDGERYYLLHHPRNSEWLNARSQLNMTPWIEGFERSYKINDNNGELRLKLETDPLEELKLGSHVGTCTGLGGRYSVAAFGVVLDINKRVIYAINSRGKVVARQTIAVTKGNELFCQAIYPNDALLRWHGQFEKFTNALAEEIGIKVYKGDESSEDVVERLVAEYSYGDGRLEKLDYYK